MRSLWFDLPPEIWTQITLYILKGTSGQVAAYADSHPFFHHQVIDLLLSPISGANPVTRVVCKHGEVYVEHAQQFHRHSLSIPPDFSDRVIIPRPEVRLVVKQKQLVLSLEKLQPGLLIKTCSEAGVVLDSRLEVEQTTTILLPRYQQFSPNLILSLNRNPLSAPPSNQVDDRSRDGITLAEFRIACATLLGPLTNLRFNYLHVNGQLCLTAW